MKQSSQKLSTSKNKGKRKKTNTTNSKTRQRKTETIEKRTQAGRNQGRNNKTEQPFLFKQKSQDFIVEENLPFTPTEKGDALFVYYEKTNKTTMEIVDHLCKKLNISRMTLGIAGLKDKKALTRQRISIYKSALTKMGGTDTFLDTLAEQAKILEVHRHTHPIGLTTPITNTFHIRLRGNRHFSPDEKKTIKDSLHQLCRQWVPNLFGEQRFGIEGRNRQEGEALLAGDISTTSKITNKKDIVFKIQAYASKLFNDYLFTRHNKDQLLVDGDIISFEEKGKVQLGQYNKEKQTIRLFDDQKSGKFFYEPEHYQREIPFNKNYMIATWPVVWFNLLTAIRDTEAGKREQWFLTKYDLTAKGLALCKEYKLFGRRRTLRMIPMRPEFTFQKSDLLMRFTLPAGSYASVLIRLLEEQIETSLSSNK